MADLAGAQGLRLGWKAEECVDLSVHEQLARADCRTGHPVDVLGRVEPDMRRHGRYEDVGGGAETLHPHCLALEIADAADALARNQLEAAHVHAADDPDLVAGIDRNDDGSREMKGEVDLAARDRPRLVEASVRGHVLDIGEALGAKQLTSHVLGSDAEAGAPGQADGGGFGSSVLRDAGSPPRTLAATADPIVVRKLRRFCWLISLSSSGIFWNDRRASLGVSPRYRIR